MTDTAERTYEIIQAKDGTYAVQVTPYEDNAPLTIYGFINEAEAMAWVDWERSRNAEMPPEVFPGW